MATGFYLFIACHRISMGNELPMLQADNYALFLEVVDELGRAGGDLEQAG
jgi:hypothetical protein